MTKHLEAIAIALLWSPNFVEEGIVELTNSLDHFCIVVNLLALCRILIASIFICELILRFFF